MINFRYHVVSLTAVFLALAIGLVVGTAALNGPMADSLNDSVNALGKDNKNLREQVGHLQKEVNQEEDFVEDLFVASTHSYLLFFTTKGKVHWLKVHEIPEGGRQAKGKAMVNVLSLAEGEAVEVETRQFTVKAQESVTLASEGEVKLTSAGETTVEAEGDVRVVGKQIHLN